MMLVSNLCAVILNKMFSLFLSRKPFIFFMVSRYIVVDTSLYLYNLPINYLLHPYSSLIEVQVVLTPSFPPHHHSLLILHFICCHSTPLLFLQSLQLHPTYLHYYVNRYILKQSVFPPGPRYVLSESYCSIYLVSFPLVLVTLKYICLFILNHCVSILSSLCLSCNLSQAQNCNTYGSHCFEKTLFCPLRFFLKIVRIIQSCRPSQALLTFTGSLFKGFYFLHSPFLISLVVKVLGNELQTNKWYHALKVTIISVLQLESLD